MLWDSCRFGERFEMGILRIDEENDWENVANEDDCIEEHIVADDYGFRMESVGATNGIQET
jgi:hypothetical protein